jgi:hypothetical protein
MAPRIQVSGGIETHEVLYYSKGRDDTTDVRILPLDGGRTQPQTEEELSLAARRLTDLRAISYFKIVHMTVDLGQFDSERREILGAQSDRFDVSPTYVFDGRNITDIDDPVSLKQIYEPDRRAFEAACDEARVLKYGYVVLCRDGSYMPFSIVRDRIISTRLAKVVV